jgi:hypothetical protein
MRRWAICAKRGGARPEDLCCLVSLATRSLQGRKDGAMAVPACIDPGVVSRRHGDGEAAPPPFPGNRFCRAPSAWRWPATEDPGGEAPTGPAVEVNPDWSVDELTAEYNKHERVKVSRSTMVRAVARLGFTREKRPSLPMNATPSALRPGARPSSRRSAASPLRIWYWLTKPARTRR